MEYTKARCCMFDEADAEKAVKEADLEHVERLYDGDRHVHDLCRCRKCGAFVMRQYEEIAMFDWDNPVCYDRYYSVGSPEEARELEKKHLFSNLSGVRRHIEVSWFEESPEHRSYRYCGSDFGGK